MIVLKDVKLCDVSFGVVFLQKVAVLVFSQQDFHKVPVHFEKVLVLFEKVLVLFEKLPVHFKK